MIMQKAISARLTVYSTTNFHIEWTLFLTISQNNEHVYCDVFPCEMLDEG